MNNENYRALISGRVHTIGKTDFIVNSFAAAEGSKTAAEFIMDMLLSVVRNMDQNDHNITRYAHDRCGHGSQQYQQA